jgi:hypothetical protein
MPNEACAQQTRRSSRRPHVPAFVCACRLLLRSKGKKRATPLIRPARIQPRSRRCIRARIWITIGCCYSRWSRISRSSARRPAGYQRRPSSNGPRSHGRTSSHSRLLRRRSRHRLEHRERRSPTARGPARESPRIDHLTAVATLLPTPPAGWLPFQSEHSAIFANQRRPSSLRRSSMSTRSSGSRCLSRYA